MNIFKNSVVQLAGVAGMLALLWVLLDSANSNLAQLPVLQVPQVTAEMADAPLPEIRMAWAGAGRSPLAGEQSQGQSQDDALERAFEARKPLQVEGEQPAGPDYVELFRAELKVEGVMGDGAFIGGRYVRPGDSVHLKANAAEDAPTATMVGASRSRIEFLVDGRSMVLRKDGGIWQ